VSRQCSAGTACKEVSPCSWRESTPASLTRRASSRSPLAERPWRVGIGGGLASGRNVGLKIGNERIDIARHRLAPRSPRIFGAETIKLGKAKLLWVEIGQEPSSPTGRAPATNLTWINLSVQRFCRKPNKARGVGTVK
jgi:hypothetical protein